METKIIRKKPENGLAEWVRFEASSSGPKSEMESIIEQSRVQARDVKKYFAGLPAVKAVPKGKRAAILDSFNEYYAFNQRAILGAANNFMGFSALSYLAQDPLINRGVSTLSDEMTREWGELSCKDDLTTEENESKSDAVKVINEALNGLNAKEVFRQAARKTGFFGGCLGYLDLRGPGGEMPSDEELMKPVYKDGADAFNRSKLSGQTLRGIRIIEPINITPGNFNSTDPLAPDFYDPEMFFVLGKPVHRSRFLYFADNLPPQVLKPCYLFFGVSLAQMAYEYVNDFYKLKNAAERMLQKFSLTYLATPVDSLIERDGPGAVQDRVATIAKYRDNDSIVIIDSLSERLEQINSPLAGVKDIWYASLELIPAIFGIPATKLLEISPSGFQSTGEFEMRNFYDAVAVKQANVFDAPMRKLINILCLVNGIEDPGLIWTWNSLYKLSEKEQAEVNRMKAETANLYYAMGAVDNVAVAESLKSDEKSGFENIDLPLRAEPDETDLDAEGQNPNFEGPAAPANMTGEA